MLISETDALNSDSGTQTITASVQLVAANVARNGLLVSVDAAAGTNAVYLLLGSGTASATSFHVSLGAGGAWDGSIGGVLWRGAVQVFASASTKVGVTEV